MWLIDGDGSFQMTSEELAAAFLEGAPVKIALLNNSVYGMVRQWQTLFYNNHYSATILHEEEKTGLRAFRTSSSSPMRTAALHCARAPKTRR